MAPTPEESVIDGMGRCLQRLQTGPWLDSKVVLKQLLKARAHSRPQTMQSNKFNNLSDYAAASSLLHCTDGWSYLGRAANALANGLLDEATHFAYYSELRSAISILACSGTVIHKNRSFTLSNGNCMTVVAGSTHKIVWNMLNNWTQTRRAGELVGEMINIGGVSLIDWLNSRTLSGNTPSVISGLLQIWGVDLRLIEADRIQRNIASYQPSRLGNLSPTLTVDQICDLLLDLPSLIEPSRQGTFPSLDMQLLAQALRLGGGLFSNLGSQTSGSGRIPSRSEIETLVDEVVGGGVESTSFAARLEFLMNQGSSIIRGATDSPTKDYPTAAEDILGMMGRALILARIATGYVDSVRDASGVATTMLAPWADNLGTSLGYWDSVSRPVDLVELWDDMVIAVASLRTNAPLSTPLFSIHESSPWEILILTSLTRTALWSLSA